MNTENTELRDRLERPVSAEWIESAKVAIANAGPIVTATSEAEPATADTDEQPAVIQPCDRVREHEVHPRHVHDARPEHLRHAVCLGLRAVPASEAVHLCPCGRPTLDGACTFHGVVEPVPAADDEAGTGEPKAANAPGVDVTADYVWLSADDEAGTGEQPAPTGPAYFNVIAASKGENPWTAAPVAGTTDEQPAPCCPRCGEPDPMHWHGEGEHCDHGRQGYADWRAQGVDVLETWRTGVAAPFPAGGDSEETAR